jgi:aquaporin NIP
MKWAPEIAEAVGTFALVFAACGAIMVNSITGEPGHVGISLVFGLVIGAMIYAVGHLSGAHFNPAVTIAFAATGHFPWPRVASYILAQLTGGILASGALALTLVGHTTFGETTVSSAIQGPPAGLLIEVLITALLMFVISSVATDGRAVGRLAGSAIGSTVALSAMWAGPLTGAGMNPARSIAPALVGGTASIASLWIYIVGPVLGALIGALLYEALRPGVKPEGRNAA